MEKIRICTDYWIKCIIITAACWPVGIISARSIARLFNLNLSGTTMLIWIGILTGSLLGIAQWLISEDKLCEIRMWMLATTLGTVIGLTVTTSILIQSRLVWTWFIAGALGGFVLGISQSLAITREQRKDLIWILMTSTSWALAFIIGLAFIREVNWEVNIADTDAILMTWITGWGIMGMLAVLAMFALAPIDNQRDRSVPMQWC